VRESAYWAEREGHPIVTGDDMMRAIAQRIRGRHGIAVAPPRGRRRNRVEKEDDAMALELWRPRLMDRSPFRDLARLGRDMEEAFGWPAWPWGERETGWAPAVDMIDRKDEIVLRADLPGLAEKDIEVTVQDGSLTIRGERKEEKEEKKEDYYCCERRYGLFARTLPLPAGVEADKVKATFKNGVLEVSMPKAKEAKGKKIEVKAA
jgi:HSP20 family protein